jgi:hypothetical protein
MDAFDNCRVKQARPSRDQQLRFDDASDLDICCRCVSAAAGWLQGVRCLFAAWPGSTIGSP